MKLTSKGRYAVMALADLAKFDAVSPVSLRDISLRQGISLLYLEQIFLKLKKKNIVNSVRGTNGGYVLTKQPGDIKLQIFLLLMKKLKQLNAIKNQKKDAMANLQNVLLIIFGMNLNCI